MVERERLGESAKALHDAALEHGEIRIARGRLPQCLEFIEQALRSSEIAYLDRRAQRLLEGMTLQFHGQRRGRGVERMESLARLGPFALLRLRERAPQCGIA